MTDAATQLGPVTFERRIEATPDEAFALFTEPERLRRWQAISASVDLRVGGDYRLTITPSHTAAGTYTEIEPGKRVVFTWGWVDSDDLAPGASTVEVDFEPDGDGTRVRITHRGLTPDQAAEPALAAWRSRGIEGEVPFGDGQAPAALSAGILGLEFFVHAWDFARATDQPFSPPEPLTAFVTGVAEQIIQPDNRGDGKGFAEIAEPAHDDAVSRLMAFTGRAT